MPASEFFPISGDWDNLGIPNLAQMTNVSNKNLLKAIKYLVSRKGGLLGLTIKVNLTRVNDCQL